MKKKTLNTTYYISIILLILFAGCNDFLETSPTDQVYHDNVFKTTELAETVLDGTYRMMREEVRNDQKTFDLRLDVMDGRDVMMNKSGFFNGDYELGIDKTTQDLGEVASLWNYYYRLINQTNNIVANIVNANGIQSDKDRINGEALTIRAYAYFYLINHFQHAWIKGKENPGVPIYTEPTSSETLGNPRGTVEDVYIRIITDLKDAINLLPAGETRLNKGYINQNVAKGLLARTYLFQEDYENAAKYAKEARSGYPLMSQEQYVASFNDFNNPEWMWGLPFNSKEILVSASFFSDYDLERPNSTWSIRINNRFYGYFSETDCRAKLSVNGNYPLIMYKNEQPIDLSITESDIMDSLITRKFRDKTDLTGHYVLMRSAEMMLIEAEAEAELGNNEKARDLLFEIQQRADNLALKSSSTGEDLVNEILLERRKELYGEGLASVFDLKRKNLPLIREGNQMQGGFEAGSNRLVWQIPMKEIDANQNISESEQNPL